MKDSRKTLMISGIICLVSSLLSCMTLWFDLLAKELIVYSVVMDSVAIVLSITTGVIYLCVMNKSNDWLVDHRMLFVVLMFLNIVNGLIVWLVSFWVEIVITEQYRIKLFNQTNKPGQEGDITLHDNDYEITSKVDYIKSEIEKLEELKRKHMITEEEFNRLREDVINKNL